MQPPKFQNSPAHCHNIVIMGAPGAGKGTQAKRLAADLQPVHISTGEMLRAIIQSDSLIGSKVRARIDSGQLVSDELVLGLAADRLRQPDVRRGYVLDGFPRTAYQAEVLDESLAAIGLQLTACIYLTIDRDTIVDRINRRRERESRSDDTPATIRRRLDVFHREIVPLVDYYRSRELLVEICGRGDIDEDATAIRRTLGRSRVEVA
jgi:adenylate kinase